MPTLTEQFAALNNVDLAGLRAKIAAAQADAEKRLAEQRKETWSEEAIRQRVVPVLERLSKLKT